MSKRLPKAEWDKVADWWDTEAGNAGVFHQQIDIDPAIFKVLGNIKNKKVIEIGCGNGYFARILVKKGAKVTATDLSSKLISHAIERERFKPSGIKYLIRDAANLQGIKTGSFDLAIGNMCLMDISDAKNTIKEVSRVLRKGGRFIFSITHPVFCDFRQKWVIYREKRKKYFARAISRYMSSSTEKHVLWAGKVEATQYHRSIETYVNFLRNANLLVSEYKEITSKEPMEKAKKEDGDVTLRRRKYRTIREKEIKELAIKEIPMFLIFGSVKIK